MGGCNMPLFEPFWDNQTLLEKDTGRLVFEKVVDRADFVSLQKNGASTFTTAFN